MEMKTLVDFRKQAEKAVSDMADGPLKVKAFEMILNKLLDGAEMEGSGREKANTKPKAQKKSITSKDEKSIAGRILRMREEGFLKELRRISEIQRELAASGWHYPVTSLSGPLQALVRKRELRRLKVKEGNKSVWKYSEI